MGGGGRSRVMVAVPTGTLIVLLAGAVALSIGDGEAAPSSVRSDVPVASTVPVPEPELRTVSNW